MVRNTLNSKYILLVLCILLPRGLFAASVEVESESNVGVSVTVDVTGQTQYGNSNPKDLYAYDPRMASGLNLKIIMPKTGDYRSVILETDGKLPTKKTYKKVDNKYVSSEEDALSESSVLTLALDGVQLTNENLVLDVYIAILPVDFTAHTLKIRVYDVEGNLYPIKRDIGGRVFVKGKITEFLLVAEEAECSGLPLVIVNTVNRDSVKSKEIWQEGTSYTIISQNGSILDAPGKIKGRGNMTWTYPKKPYAVKFSKKQSPFGFPAHKNWVLLAESCDRSLLRTAYMCAISKAAGIEWTINYQYVNLFLNGEYMGVYVFTDKVEVSEDRIKVEEDGFVIEDDHYYKDENLFFFTDKLSRSYTFKYPDDKNDIVKDDDNFIYICSFMNGLERALLKLPENNKDISYLDYIDVVSFAKFHIANEVFINFDPNLYYVLPTQQSKLKMLPMWDSEWSLGLWNIDWKGDPYPIEFNPYWETVYYFYYLFNSPTFREAVKTEWVQFKSKVQEVKDEVESVRQAIAKAQSYNFLKWLSPGHQLDYGIKKTWEEEVQRINTFFDKRIKFIERQAFSW